jgi:hypothetical protein
LVVSKFGAPSASCCLTAKRAFDLLLALVERRERVVSTNELLDLVWPGLVAIAWLTWLGFSIPIFLGLSALLVPARQGSSRLGFHRFT